MRRTGDMTPQIMVLGLVAERSGTVSDVQRRLSDLFSSADFPSNAAHTGLPALAKKGHVRLLEEGSDPDRADAFYEVTTPGLEHLRDWVRSSPPRPAMREPIHGKVEFATLDELAEVIIMVRAEVRTCQFVSDDVHARMLAEQRSRIAARGKRKGWQEELDDELSDAHLSDVTLAWDDFAERRRKLGNRLEDIHRRFKSRAG